MVNAHQPVSVRDASASSARAPSSRKNCERSINDRSGTAAGAHACHGSDSASTQRATTCGSACNVVLQPNARSVNVTSAAPVAMAARLNATAAVCDQNSICHFANRPAAAARAVMPAEQRRNVARRTGDAAIDRSGPGARIDGFQQILNGAQTRYTARNQQQRQQRASASCAITSVASSVTTLTGREPS